MLRIKKSTIVHHFFQNPMVDCVAATILKTENKKHFTFWRIGNSSLMMEIGSKFFYFDDILQIFDQIQEFKTFYNDLFRSFHFYI